MLVVGRPCQEEVEGFLAGVEECTQNGQCRWHAEILPGRDLPC